MPSRRPHSSRGGAPSHLRGHLKNATATASSSSRMGVPSLMTAYRLGLATLLRDERAGDEAVAVAVERPCNRVEGLDQF